MKSKPTIAMTAALVAFAALWTIIASWAFASIESDRDEIVALNRNQLAAFDKKDLDKVMSYYVDDKDVVFYEDTTPFQLNGVDALRKLDQDFFDGATQIHTSMEEIAVVSSGDLAVARYTLLLDFKDKGVAHNQRGRFTQVLKKVNGRWLIWHEHLSVPYDPATGKAVLQAKG